ncbi:MAG: hypothetical protein J1F65_03190 [Clostridiales bacterium]|nr:hypothetical protein [Clostridiales bacterium]
MKTQKRLLTWILVAVLAVMSLALVACVDKPQPVQLTDLTLPQLASNQMAVIIKNGENDYTCYVVTLGKGGAEATTAEEVLDYLVEAAALDLDCSGSGSEKFINRIGGIIPNPNADDYEYVEIFTSNSAFFATWAGANEYTVDNVTLKSAGVGIHDLGVTAGDILYFELSVFAW